jgi:hypothetical protein
MNPCTDDTCDPTSGCHYAHKPDGPLPPNLQVEGDCSQKECVGGVTMNMADEDLIENDCKSPGCIDGIPGGIFLETNFFDDPEASGCCDAFCAGRTPVLLAKNEECPSDAVCIDCRCVAVAINWELLFKLKNKQNEIDIQDICPPSPPRPCPVFFRSGILGSPTIFPLAVTEATTLARIPQGTYDILFIPVAESRLAPTLSVVSLTGIPSSTVIIEFDFKDGFIIRGQLVDTIGQIISGVVLHPINQVNGLGPYDAFSLPMSDSDGSFAFTLEAGSYEVTVIPPQVSNLKSKTITVSGVAGDSLDLGQITLVPR